MIPRHKLIGAVHAAAKAYRMDDDDRRDLMKRVTGKDSCSKMTERELGKVLDAINGGRSPATRRTTLSPMHQKVRALWITLYNLGVVDNGDDKALDAWVARQTDQDALRFVPEDDLPRLIEAARDWASRAGGVQWGDRRRDDPRTAVVEAQVRILFPSFTKSEIHERLKIRFGLKTHWVALTDRHRDFIIRELGKEIRGDGK